LFGERSSDRKERNASEVAYSNGDTRFPCIGEGGSYSAAGCFREKSRKKKLQKKRKRVSAQVFGASQALRWKRRETVAILVDERSIELRAGVGKKENEQEGKNRQNSGVGAFEKHLLFRRRESACCRKRYKVRTLKEERKNFPWANFITKQRTRLKNPLNFFTVE